MSMKSTATIEQQTVTAQDNPVNVHDHRSKTVSAQVAIIGLGYVGLPLALQADRRGYSVVGLDTNKNHIHALNQFLVPDFLGLLDAKYVPNHGMEVSTDPAVLTGTDIFIVCVPTPVSHDHEPDLEPLINATRSVAPYLKRGSLLIVESTVNPGVCDEVLLPLIKEMSGLVPEEDFLFAYCPERINPGDTSWDVRTIPRVLGGSGPKSTEAGFEFYSSIIDAPIHRMGNIKEAEAVKITENSFRDINIAFVNELAMSFKKLGIDIMNVLEGASTKPFGFMTHYPGCGVGGHCIPVDPYYLIAYARQNGFSHTFLKTAREINNQMPTYTISLLETALKQHGKELPHARIALLGISYKRNVPDLRESPALVIREELEKRGAVITTFDPYIEQESTVHSLDEALEEADAVLIATDHDDFTSLQPYQLTQRNIPIVIDGRNCLPKEEFIKAGITYHGIGR
jgi:UDP-N-acetyl-D-glucosamine dehydrogenase